MAKLGVLGGALFITDVVLARPCYFVAVAHHHRTPRKSLYIHIYKYMRNSLYKSL